MHGPDGRNYPNESVFAEIASPGKIVIQHVSEPKYRLTIVLAASAAGTAVSWSRAFENSKIASRLERVVVPANEQNLDRLSAEVLRKTVQPRDDKVIAMKGRESGMPPQELWEGFFNPTAALKTMEVTAAVNDVAEFGCGYGTFTIPAARMVRGVIHALDIDAAMVEATRNAAKAAGLQNIKAMLRDFAADGTGLKAASVDYVMLFNILHIENPDRLLKEAWRILSPGGGLGVVHWNYDPSTPRGPSMGIRPKPEQCIQWAKAVGFCRPRQYDLKPYHYGIVMRKETQ